MPRNKRLPTEEEFDQSLATPPAFLPLNGFRRKRKLTLEVRSISKLQHLIFRCDSELAVTELPSKYSQTGKAEATTLDVTDMLTSEQFTCVLNAVSASSLKRAGSPLVGRFFEIEVGEEHQDRRYRDTQVTELEEGE
jgi:hypothetical protein